MRGTQGLPGRLWPYTPTWQILRTTVLSNDQAVRIHNCLCHEAECTVRPCSIQVARWANAAGRLPSDILQELASLARQDMLRFELDSKPTLAFQVSSSLAVLPSHPHHLLQLVYRVLKRPPSMGM